MKQRKVRQLKRAWASCPHLDLDVHAVLIDDVEAEGLVPHGVLAPIDGRARAELLSAAAHDAVGILLAEPVGVLQILGELNGDGHHASVQGHGDETWRTSVAGSGGERELASDER